MRGTKILNPIFGILALGLVSCGGGGDANINDGEANVNTSEISGQIIDEPISNLLVKNINSSVEVRTDKDGKFTIIGKKGDILEFRIGNLVIGNYTIDSTSLVLTPQIINSNKSDVIISLFHQLDTDNNPTDGISLPEEIEFDEGNIDDIDIGDNIQVFIGNTTKTIVLEPVNSDIARINDYLAKGYNILKFYEDKNILEKPVQVNNNAKLTEFKYLHTQFDVWNRKIYLDSYAEGTIFGEVEGETIDQGYFKCYGTNGVISYNNTTNKLEGITNFQCEAHAHIQNDEWYAANFMCNGILTIENIDWNNRVVNGTFELNCKSNEYPFLDFYYKNSITLIGK